MNKHNLCLTNWDLGIGNDMRISSFPFKSKAIYEIAYVMVQKPSCSFPIHLVTAGATNTQT